MKKSRLLKLYGTVIAVALAALALRLALVPMTVYPPALPVRVAVEQLPMPKEHSESKNEAMQTATVEPALPEREAILPPGEKPAIAIIIDDMGLSLSGSRHAMKLPAVVTLSFIPYADRLTEQAAEARESGHELMLHMPMEPMGKEDPGPGALLTALPLDEIRRRLNRAMDSFEGFDGMNNHMGSRFTADTQGMEAVVEELGKRGLFFLDSRTSVNSLGLAIAQKHGVPSVARDVFLDDILTPDAIRAQLTATEHAAKRKGYAVAIGHPHEVTLKAIEAWLPEAEQNGFVLVPVHDLIKPQLLKASAPQ